MVCIYCGHGTSVTNSRPKARNASVWRRRVCDACVAQFTTIELPDYATAFSVETNNKLSPFNRDRLFMSLHKSLGHRKDALSSSTALTSTVISHLVSSKAYKEGVISCKDVAKTAYKVLKRFDPLSAHTFKAYHLESLKDRG